MTLRADRQVLDQEVLAGEEHARRRVAVDGDDLLGRLVEPLRLLRLASSLLNPRRCGGWATRRRARRARSRASGFTAAGWPTTASMG